MHKPAYRVLTEAIMDRAMNPGEWEKVSTQLSSSQPDITVEDLCSLLNPISLEELPMVRLEIRQRAERIFDNWRALKAIVQRHEATIQKRWMKKTKMKRRELLLTMWPNMARDHRPDIWLDKKACSPEEMKKRQRLLQVQKYEGSQREALLMPYINLQDLSKTEPLLLMINARARWHPHAFAHRDLQLSTQFVELTKWRLLVGYIMDFDGQSSDPDTYGSMRQEKWSTVVNVRGADPRIANGTINPGDGLWILEIQDRMYEFLLDTARRILHDIPAGVLTGPEYNIQPEPPLPSANHREDGVVSLASINLEAIYSFPGEMNLLRLQSLVTAKAGEEEDKLWALREDPGRFSEDLGIFIDHMPQHLGPDVRHHKGVLITGFLLSHFICVEFWGGLVGDITDLVAIKKQYFDNAIIEPGKSLPEPFAMALHKLHLVLSTSVEQRLSVLRSAAYSSPPLRPYMQRDSTDKVDNLVVNSRKHLPRHIYDFAAILSRLFSNEECLKRMGHIAGVQSLLEQYDMFVNTVPNARQAVSSYVAQEISTLSLLSECLRQIHLFQPWVATSHKEMETQQVKDVLRAHLNDRRGETVPVERFRSSDLVRSIGATIEKTPYPAHKKRTAASVDKMQKAENLLDQFWDSMLAEMEQQNALLAHCKKVLFPLGRQLQRTPDWVDTVKSNSKRPAQVAASKGLVQSFGGLIIDDDNKMEGSPKEKTKIKTRGTPAPQSFISIHTQEAEQEDRPPTHTIEVDRRAMKVFSILFHTAFSTSKPGEVPWTEFLHAMRSAGFGMESLQGSAWQFTPHGDKESHITAGKRSILFHEPHPHSRIPFRDARRLGRRLARTYGWSGETFSAK